jgi:multidrug resistance protein, MATE family
MTTANCSRPTATRDEVGALWRLAWPILIGQIATVGMAVSDTIMAGRLGVTALAAVSLGVSVWTVINVSLVGLMMPINALVAHEFGAGRHDKIAQTTRQALWMALGLGLIAMGLMNAATFLFGHLQLEPEVQAQATRFVFIISFGLPAFTIFRTLYGYSASINKTKPMMRIALAALAYNIVANWLLIYGHGGLPQLGALGCALATASGLWLMAGAMLLTIRRDPGYRSTDPMAAWEWPDLQQIGGMLKQGLPMAVTYFAEVSAFSAVAFLVARFGVVAIAANQITLNVTSVVFVVPLSFGIASITRVGQALGEGNPARARQVAWVGVSMSIAFGLMSAIGIALFSEEIAAAYSIDPQVQKVAAGLLLIAALFQLSDAAQITAACAVRGYKVTRPAMLIHLTSFWGVALPLGCLLGLGGWLGGPPMQGAGFWIGLAIGLSVAAVLLLGLLDRLSRAQLGAADSGVGCGALKEKTA